MAAALRLLMDQCRELGLDLSLTKNKLTCLCHDQPNMLHTLVPQALLAVAETGLSKGLIHCCFEILVAPIGDPDFCGARTQQC